MSLSELCIRRPVMTGLLSTALVLVGLMAYFKLPVAALPRVDYPVIVVSATLPGASPEIMASSVAAPLEREFTTIAGIETISSNSQLGSTSITLEFVLDRDIDAAAQDVQAALARAARKLPQEMTTPPSFRKVNPADAPVLLLALSSPTIPLSQLDDYAETIISPRISRLSGVAEVQVWGAQKFAVRIQVDPNALAAKGIGVDQVEAALVSANDNSPVGTLSGARRQITLLANDQLRDAAAFRDIIISDRGNAPVRLREVAKVVDSVENTRTASWNNGARSIVLAIQRQPDANTVDVVDRVRALLPTLGSDLPPSVSVAVLNDRALSVRHAVADVQFTLLLTVGLVVLVIFLFLRRLAVTVIPALAIPISLIVTCAGMWWLGFSLDNISLLGLTLCVGLVVDDAIVMLENIHRYVEEGMTPFAAALKGSREIGFTIVSITASLIAVFIPLFAMGGVVGRVFFEFAMVVTMAIVISAVMSLTLTPMMASRIGAPRHGAAAGRFERICESAFDGLLAGYRGSLDWVLRHRRLTLMVLLGTVAASVWLFVTIPKGFFPVEDIGQISVTTEAGQDISFAAMAELQQKAAAIVQADPAVATVTSSVGSGGNTINTGRMFLNLVPREKRPPAGAVIQRLRRALSQLTGMNVFMQPVQNLRIGGRQSKALYQYTLQGIETEDLYAAADRMQAAMAASPLLQDVTSDLQLSAPQARLDIDRAKAAELGVPVDRIRSTLYSAFGARQVSTIYTPTNDYQVILEVDPALQGSIEDLKRLYVSGAGGRLVPVESFASIEQSAGPLSVNHVSQLPAVTLSFNLAPGHALGEAVDAIHAAEARENLPATVSTSFAGTAKVFQDASANQLLMLLAAVLVIYTVLGVLYESLIHPLTILSGLPSAALGALITLHLFGLELSVVAIIGVLMLIGIVKKNAIMMIDFALSAQREQGLPAEQAIRQACLLRFRPIMMTTMAALLGTLPIALGAGASAELRQPLGLAVVGGLIVSQALTLYITPVIYLYLDRLAGRRGAVSAEVVPASPSRRSHRAA
jgi:HAE1 family hydrophobic/amphiphilic exporter-1